MRKHGQNADSPGVFDGLVRATPTEEVVLVRIHLDIQERLASAVRTHKFFVQARSKELCRVDNVLEFLLVENRANSWIDGFLFHAAKYSYLSLLAQSKHPN